MRDLLTVRALGALGCVAVALVALLFGWLAAPPDLDADDAREVAERSLEEVGFADVEVHQDLDRREHRPSGGGEPVDAWRTRSTVDGGTVELWVAASDGAAVFLLDRNANGTERLLTDEQFEQLRTVSVRPPAERRLWRNVAATGATAAIAVVGVLLAGTQLRRAPE